MEDELGSSAWFPLFFLEPELEETRAVAIKNREERLCGLFANASASSSTTSRDNCLHPGDDVALRESWETSVEP